MNAVRAVMRGVGELLITAGVVVLLFCAYQLIWTNVQADRAADKVADQIRHDWAAADPQPAGKPVKPTDFGKGFAFMHIPRLGDDFSVPVVEGVNLDDLAKGVGHYPDTVPPGRVGNFSVAGHRATHGEPFAHLDRMRKGDAIVVETKDSWFTYRVDKTQIVQPSDVWVIAPVPGETGTKPTERLLTLTTCNPRWASTQRLIVFAHLEDSQPVADGAPDVLAAGG